MNRVDDGRSPAREKVPAPVRRLRILTDSLSLDPVGGIELSTLQDSITLAARGNTVDVMFGADGEFRSRYIDAGVNLEGPISFAFDVHRPVPGVVRFVGPARWARSRKPDVLWLNRSEHIFWAQAVARWSRCPIVCHLHHVPNFNRTSTAHRGVAHFIAVSRFIRDKWVEAGIDPDRIRVVYNAFPRDEYPRGGMPERAAARHQLRIPPDVAVVLYYGRMSLEKGVGTLFDAWAELGLRNDQALLLLVGSPAPAEDLELTQSFHHLDPSTTRWFPAQYDVVPFLHAADLVVFPSRLEEAFGRVVTEGLSSGRPVIASRTGAVPEILTGPMDRLLFEMGNSSELSAKISSFRDWRYTEPQLGTDCADWVEARFPYDEHITALEDTLARYGRRRRE